MGTDERSSKMDPVYGKLLATLSSHTFFTNHFISLISATDREIANEFLMEALVNHR